MSAFRKGLKIFTYHYEVPHTSSLSHQRGHGAAAWHQYNFNRLCVQKVIQQLGSLTGITLWTHKYKQHDCHCKRLAVPNIYHPHNVNKGDMQGGGFLEQRQYIDATWCRLKSNESPNKMVMIYSTL